MYWAEFNTFIMFQGRRGRARGDGVMEGELGELQDAPLLALKMEERATTQESRQPHTAWKGKEMNCL